MVGVDDVEYLEEGVLDVPDILHRDYNYYSLIGSA